MTMDPRFGELSRAMRNRAVEIYLLQYPHEPVQDNDNPVIQYPLDSSLYRFRHFQEYCTDPFSTVQQKFETLGFSDAELFGELSSTDANRAHIVPYIPGN